MGSVVVDQRPYEFAPEDGQDYGYPYDFACSSPKVDPHAVATLPRRSTPSLLGERPDTLDRLILAHGLTWKEVRLFRANHYLIQLGLPHRRSCHMLMAYPDREALRPASTLASTRTTGSPTSSAKLNAKKSWSRFAKNSTRFQPGRRSLPAPAPENSQGYSAHQRILGSRIAFKIASILRLCRTPSSRFSCTPARGRRAPALRHVARGGSRWSTAATTSAPEVLARSRRRWSRTPLLPNRCQGRFHQQPPDPARPRRLDH